ncbi:MAG: nucleoside triphosphate pyrophosphohydrolase [Bacillota bacterium]
MEKQYNLKEFVGIIRTLRGENGCPWDKKQTHFTLKELLLEETYETIDAIEQSDMENLQEELGDLLLHIVLHATIAEEEGHFTMDDIITGIANKMIFRHPHVFGEATAKTAEDVSVLWEERKKEEKNLQTTSQAMKRIPKAMPALIATAKVQKKASEVGFDFDSVDGAIEKAKEEWNELKVEIDKKSDKIEEEFGDILFSTVNVSRFLKLNCEFALTKATKKFINRFEYIENAVISQGKILNEVSLAEMDTLWNEAKTKAEIPNT